LSPSFCYFLLACPGLCPAPCWLFFQEKRQQEKAASKESEGKDEGGKKSETIDNMETLVYLPDTQDLFEGSLEEDEKYPDDEGSQ